MLRFVLLATFVTFSAASGGGYGSSGSSGGYGGGSSYGSKSMGAGYGSKSMGGGYGSSGGYGQVVQAAIQSNHKIEYYDVPSSQNIQPTTIEVGASPLAVTLLFKSASSNLNIQQQHEGAQGSTQETSSEDEAHILKHSVTKPIIQEIREVITPSRKIYQEIQPVKEEILTLVARGQEQKYEKPYEAKGYGAEKPAPRQTPSYGSPAPSGRKGY